MQLPIIPDTVTSSPFNNSAQSADVGAPPDFNFKNLESGFGTPVVEFTGLLSEVGPPRSTRFGWQMPLSFVRCNILTSDAPYPHSDVKVEIKHSQAVNSAWGKFGKSVAAVMGVTMEEADPKILVGQWLHMYRFEETFGRTGNIMKGWVWNCAAIITENAKVEPVASMAVSSATVSVQPAQPEQPKAPLSVEAHALSLLDDKTTEAFFQVAILDTTLRSDATFYATILSGAFPKSMELTKKVTIDNTGVYHVV